MNVELAIVTSSTGEQVRMSVEQSSSETGVPLRCFYGDPSRKLYDALGAKYGVSNTLAPGWSTLWSNLSMVADLVVLGALLGARKQQLTNADAAWQQGANALISQGGEVLHLHRHQQPMDLGQPIEETAKALGFAVTNEMKMKYDVAMHAYTAKNHHALHLAKKMAPFVLLLLLIWLLAMWLF